MVSRILTVENEARTSQEGERHNVSSQTKAWISVVGNLFCYNTVYKGHFWSAIVPTPVGTPESIDKIGCLPHTIPRNPSPSLTSKNTSECK